jgi:hypothetical protein
MKTSGAETTVPLTILSHINDQSCTTRVLVASYERECHS